MSDIGNKEIAAKLERLACIMNATNLDRGEAELWQLVGLEDENPHLVNYSNGYPTGLTNRAMEKLDVRAYSMKSHKNDVLRCEPCHKDELEGANTGIAIFVQKPQKLDKIVDLFAKKYHFVLTTEQVNDRYRQNAEMAIEEFLSKVSKEDGKDFLKGILTGYSFDKSKPHRTKNLANTQKTKYVKDIANSGRDGR